MTHLQRLFLAIAVTEDVRRAVAAMQARVREQLQHSRVAWVTPENFHITLHFLGDVEEGRIAQLVEALRAKQYPAAFELRLQDVAAFPSAKRPRTIYVRTTLPTELLGLRKRIADVLVGFGFEIDGRPWDSHITIGRVQVQAESLKPEALPVEPITWRVESLALISSILASGGSQYTDIASFPLS